RELILTTPRDGTAVLGSPAVGLARAGAAGRGRAPGDVAIVEPEHVEGRQLGVERKGACGVDGEQSITATERRAVEAPERGALPLPRPGGARLDVRIEGQHSELRPER